VLRSEKKQFVEDLEQIYSVSSSVIVTHYHGLTVSDMTELRKKLRASDANLKVVKNTLAKIASDRAGSVCAHDIYKGPTAIAYSVDPIAAAKVVVDFAKSNEMLKIVGGVVDDMLLDTSGVESIAKMPSLDQLRGKIVGLLQAPASQLVGVVSAPAAQLARVISAYANKK